jgi:outer membrane protein, multidrug efflux system
MVGPKYHQPVPPVPAHFKEGGTPDSSTPAIAYSNWWRVFKDSELDRLEAEADAANQDVRVAVARVEQAEAGAKIARSFLFPTISLGTSASRTREAQNRPNHGNTNGLAATFNDFQMSAFLSYEVDAWGRVRHSIEAANATE